MEEIISSMSNAQVKRLKELLTKTRARKKQGCFVAEGLRMVRETPADRLESLFISESFGRLAREAGLDLSRARILSDAVFKSVSETQTPQGIMAIVRQQSAELSDLLAAKDPLLLFLENIQDPGNLGTMMRTAEGAGVTGVIMSRDTVDIYNPKTIRSTMGSLYRMPFVYVDDLCQALLQAEKAKIHVFAAHLQGSVCYTDRNYRGASGLLIGNEGNGLTTAAAACACANIRIPMAGQVESLNAAAAAAILMYEAARQRGFAAADWTE